MCCFIFIFLFVFFFGGMYPPLFLKPFRGVLSSTAKATVLISFIFFFFFSLQEPLTTDFLTAAKKVPNPFFGGGFVLSAFND